DPPWEPPPGPAPGTGPAPAGTTPRPRRPAAPAAPPRAPRPPPPPRHRPPPPPPPSGGNGSPPGHPGGRPPARRRSGIGEPVADAMDREQVAGAAGDGLDLPAEGLDVGVHRPLVGLEGDPVGGGGQG